MTTLTPELRQAIEQSGETPLRLTDPETGVAYVVIRSGSPPGPMPGIRMTTLDHLLPSACSIG